MIRLYGTSYNVSEIKNRIGILGGSFDPVHFGHIKPALALARIYQLQKIILLPCKLSPFKQNTHTSAEHRWKMIEMVASNEALFVADARELQRDEPSYSYHSVQEISEELGENSRLFWILGADSLEDFSRWFRVDDMMKLCNVLVLSRPGYQVKQNAWLQQYMTNDIAEFERNGSGSIFVTDTEQFDVSSTKIRSIIQAGQQPRFMLPGGVWNYIKRNNLYSETTEDLNV